MSNLIRTLTLAMDSERDSTAKITASDSNFNFHFKCPSNANRFNIIFTQSVNVAALIMQAKITQTWRSKKSTKHQLVTIDQSNSLFMLNHRFINFAYSCWTHTKCDHILIKLLLAMFFKWKYPPIKHARNLNAN